MKLRRRELLGSAAFLPIGGTWIGRAQSMAPRPDADSPPPPVGKELWIFFDPGESLVDRAIPRDPDTLGGKDAGCAAYIDRQLAGPYRRQAGLNLGPPFIKGTKQQGPQDADGTVESNERYPHPPVSDDRFEYLCGTSGFV